MSKYQDHLSYLISSQVVSKSRDPSLQYTLHVVGITRICLLCHQLFLPEAQFRYFNWGEGDISGSKKSWLHPPQVPISVLHEVIGSVPLLCQLQRTLLQYLIKDKSFLWLPQTYYFLAAMARWSKSSSKPCYGEMLLIWFPQVSSKAIRPEIQPGTMILK